MLDVFIRFPWLALLVGLGFALGARRRPPLRWAAGAWLLYGLYEYLIRLGVLCGEDCSIRADLLFLYPALLLVTLASVWRAVRAARQARAS